MDCANCKDTGVDLKLRRNCDRCDKGRAMADCRFYIYTPEDAARDSKEHYSSTGVAVRAARSMITVCPSLIGAVVVKIGILQVIGAAINLPSDLMKIGVPMRIEP